MASVLGVDRAVCEASCFKALQGAGNLGLVEARALREFTRVERTESVEVGQDAPLRDR